jgi:hypothetical protein
MLPSVCSTAGHACTVAADDGSFTIVLAASDGNSIVIGLIDPTTGAYISELLRREVPSPSPNPPVANNCLGKGVSGATVDIGIVPVDGKPILLKQGSDTTPNQIVIGAIQPTVVDIDGCYAHSLAIYASSSGDVTLAVTSTDDLTLWTGKYSGGTISGAQKFTLQYGPQHIAFADSATQPVVAMKTPTSVIIARVSLADGGLVDWTDITESQGGAPPAVVTGLTKTTGIDILPMKDPNQHYLGMLVSNKGSSADAYVTLFVAETLNILNSFNLQTSLSQPMTSQFTKLFVSQDNQYLSDIGVAIVDETTTTLYAQMVTTSKRPTYLNIKDDITNANIDWAIKTPYYLYPLGKTATGLAVSDVLKACAACKLPTAVAPASDGALLAVPLETAALAQEIAFAAPDVLGPIAIDDPAKAVFVLDVTTGLAKDASDKLY